MWKPVTDEWVNAFGAWDMPIMRVKDEYGNEYEAKHGWIDETWDGYEVAWQNDSYDRVSEPSWYWEEVA